ncbi:ChrR family anti-sigma-E factor [Psychromonas sp.]|uniref:ChrR family anti-sigma-E factor n=1 Tax=Psychromonas sp. TaxID=1884585 RepID=UPI00356B497C
MIKHHPTRELLIKHSSAQLPLALSIGVSVHLEMCAQCQAQASRITTRQADLLWSQDGSQHIDFSSMLNNILEQQPDSPVKQESKPVNSTCVAGSEYQLPRALTAFEQLKWSAFGPISRARIIKDADNTRASLLHIDKNGVIPSHKHKGYELTLLLEGSFADQNGEYHKGDFIWLDNQVEHAPFTREGCLCYTVQDAPLQFVSGFSKVLNPLGQLIY